MFKFYQQIFTGVQCSFLLPPRQIQATICRVTRENHIKHFEYLQIKLKHLLHFVI